MTRPERTTIGIVGNEGRFGSRLNTILQQAFEGSTWVQIAGTDRKTDAQSLETAKGFKVLVMSASIENVQANNQRYASALAQDGIERVYVNINSVQESARQAIVQSIGPEAAPTLVVNVHPYFGPQTSLEGARLIFSGVDVIQHDSAAQLNPGDVKHNWKQLLEHLAITLPQANGHPEAKPMQIIDLSEKNFTTPGGEQLSGARLHDYIAAYTQAPYHILRLRLKNEPELATSLHLPDLDLAGTKSSLALAKGVITQNPFAEAVNTLPVGHLTAADIHTWLSSMREQYRTLIKSDPDFDFVTTNVKNLFDWIDQS